MILYIDERAVYPGIRGQQDAGITFTGFFTEKNTGNKWVIQLVFGILDADQRRGFINSGIDQKPVAAREFIGVDFSKTLKSHIGLIGF